MTANQVSYNKHLEDRRHNIASEQLGRDQLREQARANTEMARHNQATENLTQQQLAQQAAWYAVQGSHFATMDAETRRHNQAMELETNRANIAREMETSRANKAHEDITKTQVGFDYDLRNNANLINKRNASTNERKQALAEKTAPHTIAQGWGNVFFNGVSSTIGSVGKLIDGLIPF